MLNFQLISNGNFFRLGLCEFIRICVYSVDSVFRFFYLIDKLLSRKLIIWFVTRQLDHSPPVIILCFPSPHLGPATSSSGCAVVLIPQFASTGGSTFPNSIDWKSLRFMWAFLLPSIYQRRFCRSKPVCIFVVPAFSRSLFPLKGVRFNESNHSIFVMQSELRQPPTRTPLDDSIDASSASNANLCLVDKRAENTEHSAAWSETVVHILLATLAITVSLQARRRVAAALLACLSIPRLIKLAHRLKLVPSALFVLFPPPKPPTLQPQQTPALVEPPTDAPVRDNQLSLLQMSVETLNETVSSRDAVLATTLATLDANLASVRDAVQTLTPAAAPSVPFAHLTEIQILRTRLARAEESRDVLQSRLFAAEVAYAESGQMAKSAQMSLDEARRTITDLRTRLATADVRLVRLSDTERQLDEALSRVDILSEQVFDLNQKCEQLSSAQKNAERRADRGDSLVSILRSKLDNMTGVRREKADTGTFTEGTERSWGQDDVKAPESLRQKIERTVSGLVSETAVLDEIKAVGESSGLLDWPPGALSGGDSASPSRADGLPPDGGFASGIPTARPEEIAYLNASQNEGAFTFSRNEFENTPSQSGSDVMPTLVGPKGFSIEEEPTAPSDSFAETGSNKYGKQSDKQADSEIFLEEEISINKIDSEYSSDPNLPKINQAEVIKSDDSIQLDGFASDSRNASYDCEKDIECKDVEGSSEDSCQKFGKEATPSQPLSYIERLEKQAPNPAKREEPADSRRIDNCDNVSRVEYLHDISENDGAVDGFSSDEDAVVVEALSNSAENVGSALQNTNISDGSDTSCFGRNKIPIGLDGESDTTGSPISNVPSPRAKLSDKVMEMENRNKNNELESPSFPTEAKVEKEVGEWKPVLVGPVRADVTEETTNLENGSKPIDEKIGIVEELIKRGRRRGLALDEADKLFQQAYTMLEEIRESISDSDGDICSEVDGRLGSCLVSWAKINIADIAARARLERAISLLERRIERAENDPTALFNAGLCLCLLAATGKTEDARMHYERACLFYERLLSEEPQSRIGFYNCGLAYISLGRLAMSSSDDVDSCKKILDMAVAKFERSLELKPGDSKAMSYLEESRSHLEVLERKIRFP